MDSFKAIIAAWVDEAGKPDRTAFARDHGFTDTSLVNVWYHRDSIPPEYWPLTISKAAERGIEGVTLEKLAALSAPKRRLSVA